MITYENENSFQFTLTASIMRALTDHRVILPNAKEGSTWVGLRRGKVSKYISIHGGHHIPEMGSFSYSFSPLDHMMQIGRYCSIAIGLQIMGPEHPWQ